VATFSRSGLATVAEGATSVTITGVSLSSTSLVFATIQGHISGLGVAGVVRIPTDSEMSICLTKSASKAVSVAWFIVG
jgi:hypothetical protein